jgi:hypothetical protein
MWEWMRDFHKEYNEDWFTRNMPRLHEVFKPVFVQEMRRLKKEAAAAQAASAPTQQGDLLSMEKSVATPAPPSGDLLSLDRPESVLPEGGDLFSLDKQAPAVPKDNDMFLFDITASVTASRYSGNDLLSLDRPVPAATTPGSDLFSMDRPAPATEPQLGDLLTMGAPAPPAPGNAAASASAVLEFTGLQDLNGPSSAPAPAAVQSRPQEANLDGIDGLMSQFDGLFSASAVATGQPAAKQSPLDGLDGFDMGLVSSTTAPASGNAQNLLDM